MKKIYTTPSLEDTLFTLIFLFSFNLFGQVGIGNTDPSVSSLLDIRDVNSNNKGVLIPRVNIPNLANSNPVTTATAADEGLLVYNTNTTTGPGFFYWNGSRWIGIDGGKNWNLSGNAGTVAGTNFLGTTDDIALQFKTGDFSRFEITSGTTQANAGRLRAFTNGTAADPIYSWNSNPNTGMFQQAANVLGFSTNGSEKLRIPNASQIHAMADGTAALPFYSWAIDTDIGMFRPSANTLAFSTAGAERMRFFANGNVQIGSINANTQKFQVDGNFRLNGALMPNNQAGTTGRVLTSAGNNNSPTWGANLDNVGQISIYITNPMNINANTINSITVTIPGLTVYSSAIVNLSGNWSSPVYDDITIHNIEVRTGEVRFAVSNNTGFFGGGVNYPGMDFTITIIR